MKNKILIVVGLFCFLLLSVGGTYLLKQDKNNNETFNGEKETEKENNEDSNNTNGNGEQNKNNVPTGGSGAEIEEDEMEESDSYNTTSFDEISMADFLNIYKDAKMQITFIGRSTCAPCRNFIAPLREVQEKYNLKINYIDFLKVDYESSAYKKALTLDSFIKEKIGYTPMLMITQNNKLIDGKVGYMNYENLVEYLTKVNVIK